MNARLPLLLAALSILSLVPAQGVTIAPGGTFSEDFDGIGSSDAATLPSGWTVASATSVRTVSAELYAGAATTTTKAGTGTGTTGAIWNFGNAANISDRGIGFLATGTAVKTGNLYLTLTASGSIPDFTISYDMKCYRNNSTQFQFQLYYSTDAGVTWTSAESSFLTTYATSNLAVSLNPAGVTSVTAQKLEVPVSSGNTIIFCWSYSVPSGTTTSNAQGLGIDNVVIVAGQNQSGLTVLPTPGDLTVSNVSFTSFSLSWGAVAGAMGYSVTLSPAAGSVSTNGTSATVTGLAEGTTYTASVVAKGNGTTTDDSNAATESVTTLTAPAVSAPNLTPTGVSPSSFTVSWPAQSSASFSVRAWTLVPADVATETFAGYPAIEPSGWEFNGTETNNTQSSNSHPVAFKKNASIVSPGYPADIDSVTFDLTHGNATSSSFSIYGSSDNGESWTTLVEYSNAGTHISNGERTVSVNVQGIRKLKFEFTKSSGNLYLGPVSVTGTNVGKQPSYLSGYGPAAVAAGATSVTISNPVAGETNFVEVTATGLTGRTATSTLPVPVPARPGVISVK